MDLFEKLSEERKLGQKEGHIPDWYTTHGYQLFKDKYQYQGQTVKESFERIAKAAAKHTDNQEKYTKIFFDLMWKGWLAPSTPVMANMGTDRGCPVSCSGGYVGDSVYKFYESCMETAMLTKNGFGTSGYFGDIRPRGSEISKGGKASGVNPVINSHVQVIRDISQGSTRRGAYAAYLDIDHEDFYEVVSALMAHPDDKNIGWNISDDFINRLESGDKDAVTRYQKAMKAKCLTGKGYFFFVDKVNRVNPPMYEEHGLSVKASNLCVAPETLILTDKGYREIQSLENTQVKVWNGEEFSETVVKRTSNNSKLLRVITQHGQELECTEYHKFYVQNDYHKPAVEVRAKDLKIGDKLIKFSLPVIDGSETLDKAYTNGFFTGDGCEYNGKKIVYLYADKRQLEEFLELNGPNNIQENQDRVVYTNVKGLKRKFFVPHNGYTIKSRLEWFAGLCDADGSVAVNGSNKSLQIGSTNKEFLKEVQLMLQTLGVNSKLNKSKSSGVYKLPLNDGSGLYGDFNCQDLYRLLVSSYDLEQLISLGFSTNRLNLDVEVKPNRDAARFNTVVGIVDEGRESATYCFTEEKRHMGMFNGILTGQCTEITLHSDSDHVFTCVLSSMNATKYDEWKNTDAVFNATIFLDCVAQEFIEMGRNIRGLEKSVRFTERGRALGLGVLGFHTYLQKNNVVFGDFQSMMINRDIFSHLDEESLRASKWMAEHWGEPEWCIGYGVRNTHRLAIAPNTSSALLCGGVSQGIEPIVENVYNQSTAAGEMQRMNPVFLELAQERGKYSKSLIKDIIDNNGSVQHLDWLNDHEKDVFKTAFEIDQMNIIKMASQRQKFIDQAQSINLFFDADEDESYISKVHREAFLDPNIKSLYYMRSKAGIQASKDGECLSCEG